jgi:UDPglucose--hexose-1-phosphate uridylyltransferase
VIKRVRVVSPSELQQVAHRRLNPLTREWVLVSPHRAQRPWLGKVEKVPSTDQPAYDPSCYLCPGNSRAGGARNPAYENTFVFDNDYPALMPDTPDASVDESGLIVARTEAGICRVVCFSPRHDLTIPRMTLAELRAVVDVWVEQYQSLAEIPWIRHIQIFENRGFSMGASNPHPHCQIWANASIPNEPAKEQASLQAYYGGRASCLLCDYLQMELTLGERLVCQNDAFAVVVPYWAVWPFETLLLSKRHAGAMDELCAMERNLLGDILKQLTIRYDNLFEIPFPYSMGFHQHPADGQPHPEWHFHAHYYPPLLRSATVQKFMVGYEMLANPQRDITAETAAARLRGVADVHYLDRAPEMPGA